MLLGVSGDSLGFSCAQTSFDISQSLSCSLSAIFTCSNALVEIDYGDGSNKLSYTEQGTTIAGGSYGVSVPTNLTADQFISSSTSGAYLAVNAEFQQDAFLVAIEFYAAVAGSIRFDVKRV